MNSQCARRIPYASADDRPKRRRLVKSRLVKSVTICLVLAVAFSVTAAHAEERVLRLGIFAPERHVHVARVVLPWVEQVNSELASEGIRIQTFTGGSLGRKGEAQLRLMETGVLDMTWFPTGYLSGRFPAIELLEIPLLSEDPVALTRAFWRLYEGDHFPGLAQMKALATSVSPPYYFHLTFEMNSLDDMAGRKIRVLNAAQAEMMQALGATPVAGIGGTEVAESLSRGLIDGALFSWHATRSMGVELLTRTHIKKAIAFSPSVLAMRNETYDSLPPRAREVIDATTGEQLSMAYIEEMLEEVESALQRVSADSRHEFYTPTAEESARFRNTFARLVDRWASDDQQRHRLISTLEQVLAETDIDTNHGARNE